MQQMIDISDLAIRILRLFLRPDLAKLLEFEVDVCPEFTSAAKAGSFSGFTAGLKGLLHPVLREDRIKNRVLHRVTKVAIV